MQVAFVTCFGRLLFSRTSFNRVCLAVDVMLSPIGMRWDVHHSSVASQNV